MSNVNETQARDALQTAYYHEGSPGSYVAAIASLTHAVLALVEEVRKPRRRVVEYAFISSVRYAWCDDGTVYRWTENGGWEPAGDRMPYDPIPQS